MKWRLELLLPLVTSSPAGDHRGSGGVHLAVEVPSAGSGAERRPADQGAFCPAEGLLQGWSRPRGELPPRPELLQGTASNKYTYTVCTHL